MDANDGGSGRTGSRFRLSTPSTSALRIVAVYAVVAGLWILTSDMLSRAMTVDPDLLTLVAIAKGVLFVLVTSGLLFVQIRHDFLRLEESRNRLHTSERRFRGVVDASPVPTALNDADGTITLMNAALTNVLGYTREDIPTLDAWWSAAYPDAAYRKVIADSWSREKARSEAEGDSFVPVEARIRCKDGSERLMLVNSALLGGESSENVVVFHDITDREQAIAQALRSNERLEQVLRSVTGLLGKVVEARDPYTQGHEEGVARIGRQIAQEMGLPDADVEGIEVAGLVHDVGKLSVPTEILTKPGVLAPVEYELIKGHARSGYDILKDVDFDWPVAEMVLQHHERMDGSGYPSGLVGEEISLAARILGVADVVEAMGAHRPYRPALGLDAAIAEINGNAGAYDPDVVAACVRLYEAGQIQL